MSKFQKPEGVTFEEFFLDIQKSASLIRDDKNPLKNALCKPNSIAIADKDRGNALIGYINTETGTFFADKDLTNPVSDSSVMELATKKLEILQTKVVEILEQEKHTTEEIEEAALEARIEKMAIRRESSPTSVVAPNTSGSRQTSSPLSPKKSGDSLGGDSQ